MNIRNRLSQSEALRQVRARLPYRVAHWKARSMQYWRWNDPSLLARNICGPSATIESIAERRDSIVWLAEPDPRDVCLDLGCGLGRVESFLAPLVKEIHAVDFSELMVQTARRRLAHLTNVYFYQNDGESLVMFPAPRFTLAWAELLFHHVPLEITEKYVSEVARVLAPGGRFVCQLPRKEFYRLHSRDVCGWMSLAQAQALMSPHFGRVRAWQDERHIYAYVFK